MERALVDQVVIVLLYCFVLLYCIVVLYCSIVLYQIACTLRPTFPSWIEKFKYDSGHVTFTGGLFHILVCFYSTKLINLRSGSHS